MIKRTLTPRSTAKLQNTPDKCITIYIVQFYDCVCDRAVYFVAYKQQFTVFVNICLPTHRFARTMSRAINAVLISQTTQQQVTHKSLLRSGTYIIGLELLYYWCCCCCCRCLFHSFVDFIGLSVYKRIRMMTQSCLSDGTRGRRNDGEKGPV